MSVREELKACGAIPLGDGFNQGSFAEGVTITGVDIGSGYCAGVALDWVRRVLQPENREGVARTGEAHLNYDSPKNKPTTVRRMAEAYHGQASSYVAETNFSTLKRGLLELKNKGVETDAQPYGLGVRIPNKIAQLLAKRWVMGQGSFSTFNLSMEPAGALTKTKIGEFLDDLNNINDPQHQSRAADGREWKSYATELDQKFETIRLSENRQVTARPFSNISVRRSSKQTDYTEAGEWMYKVRNEGVIENCCTIVSMKPTSGSTGHAVAIHQTSSDSFVLFDPNYGSFKCTSKEVLKSCLQHLFWAPRVEVSKDTLDGDRAVYCRRKTSTGQPTGEWKAMGYTVFERL